MNHSNNHLKVNSEFNESGQYNYKCPNANMQKYQTKRNYYML